MASTVWRGYISFGLISIPVRLFRAARAERVPLRRLHRQIPEVESALPDSERRRPHPAEESSKAEDMSLETPVLSPVRQVSVAVGNSDVVPEKSIVKGYEYEKGRFVALAADELKSAVAKTSTAMEIQEFVSLGEIDPVYFENSYYVVPEEAGEKAYALLYQAMRSSHLVALAQVAMHGREHVTVLRPGKSGVIAHTMFFASEVRADEEYRSLAAEVNPQELDLAKKLIEALTAHFEPEKYRDTYREKVEALLASKLRSEPGPVTAPSRPKTNVVDIADALKKSLADLKKPMASQRQPETGTAHRPKGGPVKRGAKAGSGKGG